MKIFWKEPYDKGANNRYSFQKRRQTRTAKRETSTHTLSKNYER